MQNLSWLLLLCLLAWHCRSTSKRTAAEVSSPVIGLASPVLLTPDTTRLILEDYFLNTAGVDSVQAPDFLSAKLSTDKKELLLTARQKPPRLSNLRVFFQGQPVDILLQGPVREAVRFTLPDKGYSSVQMKGEMNAWNPQTASFTKAGNVWTYTFSLSPGRYQYLYVVDGQEMQDPDNQELVSNGMGGFNNLLVVGPQSRAAFPHLYTLSGNENALLIGAERTDSLFAYWQNRQLKPEKGEASDTWRIPLPEEAGALERSWVRVWAHNEQGLSNDLLIPLQNGERLQSANQLTRYDREAQIMYFALVDRFHNGDPSNDDPVEDDRLLPKTNYRGGDIEGIRQKIEDGYLPDLHINALWLSPITQNPLNAWQEYPEPRRYYSGYHGYWPVSSSRVDHRFGTDEDLHKLVKTAHGQGVNVYLDYVCNHVHRNHPIYQNHPEWATDFYLEDSVANIRIWEEQRLTTWFDEFLPTLDFSQPEVVALQSDSAMYWIKKFGLDGFRHDATKHIHTPFWRTLTRKLKEEIVTKEGRPIYQIGETYGSRELIKSYISSGLLDAQFDFNLYFEVRDVFAKQETGFDIAVKSLQETFNYFGHHSTMGYITGNHDQPRFISLAGGALAFDESPIEAGFERDVGVGDEIGYDRLRMLNAFLFSIPGIPVIFYGDEIGLPGAGDPDCRRMMRFENLNEQEQHTLVTMQQITGLRHDRLSLTYGDTEVLYQSDKQLVLARYYFGEITLIAFNKSREAVSLSFELPKRFATAKLKSLLGPSLAQKGARVEIGLPGWQFGFYGN